MDDLRLDVYCNELDKIVVAAPNSDFVRVFTPQQARNVAQLLLSAARIADCQIQRKAEDARIAALPPVDRSARELTDGSPVTDDHRELLPSGQQKGYVVLSDAERSKGFVRPVRDAYVHKTCHTTTTMSRKLAETYARDPEFYSGTFCVSCAKHFPLDQFVWEGTDELLGT